jgi:hypothetical protein
MAKYGKKAQEEVEEAMHEYKRGELKSGKSGKKVTSKRQAVAIGLSKARKEGGKVPARASSSRRRSSGTRGKSSSRTTSARRSSTRRTAGGRRGATRSRTSSRSRKS